MKDSSEGDSQKETMIDFILSWTLRRSIQQYSEEKPILYQYCRKILGKLIGIEMTDDVQVTSVETWKQWKYIDLWANIRITCNGKEEFHAVLIENKAYTPTHHNQLARYKAIFDQVCEEYMPNTKRHYILITALDEMDVLPATEETPIKKSESPYGNTKQINEEIIADTIKSGSPIKAILLRYFNPIGAHPTAFIGEMPNGVPQNLIPYLTQTAMGIRKELSVFGDDYDTPDGSCIRDYIYVVDLAKAHVCAMTRIMEDQTTEPVEVYNIGTGTGTSVLELINAFEKATGVKLNYKIVGRRAGDIEKVWGNVDKANKVLGWKAETPLEDVLASAWKWQCVLREKGIM